MPIMILGGGRRSTAPRQRAQLLLQARVGVQRAVLPLYLRPAGVRHRVGLSLMLRAWAPQVPALPPVPPITAPAGYRVHQPAQAFLVTHQGAPAAATSYSLGNSRDTSSDGGAKDRPTATVEVNGQAAPGGDLYLVAVAQDLAGGATYAQPYGPFRLVGQTQTRKGDGWVTTLNTADTTAADAERLPEWQALTSEILPWEIEKDLTTRQQAQAARDQALAQRALKDVKCADKPGPDLRSVTVQTLIWALIRRLGVPVIVTAPLPYAGDRFWATEMTTATPGFGSMVVGTSYQVKGKKAIDALRDLLGRVGWTIRLRDGAVVIGPPAGLSSGPEETAGELDVPAALLTEVRVELVNPNPEQGSLSTPRSITLQGSAVRQWLPPLPPEEQSEEETFETVKNMTLSGTEQILASRTYSLTDVLESRTDWSRTKAGGLLRSEERRTDGLAPYPTTFEDSKGNPVIAEFWCSPREVRHITYLYEDPLYPKALTRQIEVVDAFAETVYQLIEGAERTTITQEWHEKGWLRRKITTRDGIAEWTKHEQASGTGTVTTWTYTRTTTTEEETWFPSRPGWWKHRIVQREDSYWVVYEDDEMGQPQRRSRTRIPVDIETDQGPPTAPDDGVTCPEDEPEGFPFDDPEQSVRAVFQTNGRADPTTVDIPWATSLPETYFDWIQAAARQRPSRRVTYSLPVPPLVKVGGIVQSYSISGGAGKIEATVTVEEELDV